MNIFGRSPVRGPSEHLNKAFEEWWYVLNSIGITAFMIFLGCLSGDENKYFYALLGTALVGWALYVAKEFFPSVVKKFRKSKVPDDVEITRRIMRDYLGVATMPFAYFPYFLGTFSLLGLVIYPFFIHQKTLLLPDVIRALLIN